MSHNEKLIKKAYIEIENLCKEIEAKIEKAKEIADRYGLSFSFNGSGKIHTYLTDNEWKSSTDCNFQKEEKWEMSSSCEGYEEWKNSGCSY